MKEPNASGDLEDRLLGIAAVEAVLDMTPCPSKIAPAMHGSARPVGNDCPSVQPVHPLPSGRSSVRATARASTAVRLNSIGCILPPIQGA